MVPYRHYGYTKTGERCLKAGVALATPTPCVTTGSHTHYGWSATGRLCFSGTTTTTAGTCTAPPLGTTTYTYDGNGLRTSETVRTGTGTVTSALSFSYDLVTGGKTPLLVDDGKWAYLYGPQSFGGTAPIEQVNVSTGAVRYLASVPSGVQAVIGSTGSLLEQAAYSTYGTRDIQSGSSSTSFAFQGGYRDSSGLEYLVNRYYTTKTAQFLSADPMLTSTGQPYAFTAGDPLNATDPLGLLVASSGNGGTGCHSFGDPCGNNGISAAHFATTVRRNAAYMAPILRRTWVIHVVTTVGHAVASHWRTIVAVVGTAAALTSVVFGVGVFVVPAVAEAVDAGSVFGLSIDAASAVSTVAGAASGAADVPDCVRSSAGCVGMALGFAGSAAGVLRGGMVATLATRALGFAVGVGASAYDALYRAAST